MALEELDRYKISEKLGEGAMGIVYRAFDTLLERTIAIKIIRLEHSPFEEDDFVRRFFREAKSAARLNHTNIVTVHDAGKTGDVAYIAMECLEGRDLRQLMVKDQTLPVTRIVEILGGVADALAYAHENGVIHRDIKPANIMVLDNGGVKIADFGIAQIQTGTRTMSGMIVGTSKYMSPEHIMGLPIDGRADIFSLGVILYQMLTGSAPFEGDTITTIMYRVIHEAATAPMCIAKDIPAGFEYILSKALAKDPKNRYQTAAEFATDIRNFESLANTPRLPWDTGGIADKKHSSASRHSANAGEATADLGDTTQMIPPELRPHLRPTPTIAGNMTSEPAASPSYEMEHTAKGISRPPARRTSRLFLVSLSMLSLVGIGAVIFTKTNTPENQRAAIASPAAESPPVRTPPPASAPLSEKGTANLKLAIAPWGEVYVDGEHKGVSPPMLDLEVPAGKHRIEIKNGGDKVHSSDVELKDGEIKKLKFKF